MYLQRKTFIDECIHQIVD